MLKKEEEAMRTSSKHTRRARSLFMFLSTMLFIAVLTPSGALAAVGAPTNGRIVFVKHNFRTGTSSVFLVDPDGTNLDGKTLALFTGEFYEPRWSPDGTEINMYGDGCSVTEDLEPTCAAVIADPDTGGYRWLPRDPLFRCATAECEANDAAGFGCPIWSPDGSLLACLGTSETDPSAAGVYTVRSSDGGDLTNIFHFDTSKRWIDFPIPRDFSPDGQELLYEQTAGFHRSGLFLINLDGTDNRRVSPRGLLTNHDEEASFSPSGRWILFSAYPDESHRRTVYLVRPDGTRFHEAFPECGARFTKPLSVGCGNASWSPDGSKIVYFRTEPNGNGAYTSAIVSENVDGTDLTIITRGMGYTAVELPDWGTHPLAPA
jgi:Tol biopolymer transport system component